MSWLIYALLSAFCATLYALMSKVLSINSDNPRAFSVIFGLSAAICSLLLFTIEPFSMRPVEIPLLLLTIISTILYAIYDRTQFYARKYLEASRISVIWKLSTFVSVLIAILFLKEDITIIKICAVLLILLGNILVLYNNKRVATDRGLVFAFVATFSVGIALVLDKKASAGFALPVYSAIIFFVPALYNQLFPLIPVKDLKRELQLASWKITALAGINVLTYYFILKAYTLGDASSVIPVSSSDTILAVLLAILFLKERTHMKIKIIAALCAFVGIILINL